ncbi:homoserine kinase [Hydrogenophaga sp. RWCD_12]|uniref:homoserine kinase n=1 Tax=Hydrogenophaga sp. RWCD_12 TaxID=3391190 RepID=UPI00398475CE
MTALAHQAAAAWGRGHAHLQFVAGRENHVYRLSDASGDYALRIKRPGYRRRAEVESELQWMAALDLAGLLVPRPLTSLDDRLLEEVDGHLVDLLTWLPGRTLGAVLQESSAPAIDDLFHSLGQHMARLHQASDAWTLPAGFSRVRWDADGLLGETPVWGRFWEHPGLSAEDQRLFGHFRSTATRDLQGIQNRLDFGLIHADLVRENVLLHGNRIGLLDFDDGGWGYRVFDLATTLLKFTESPGYPVLREALLRGYRSVRPIDLDTLDLFLALRAVTYVGWVVPRLGEDGAPERSRRYLATARELCQRYLSLPPGTEQ